MKDQPICRIRNYAHFRSIRVVTRLCACALYPVNTCIIVQEPVSCKMSAPGASRNKRGVFKDREKPELVRQSNITAAKGRTRQWKML